MTFFQIIAFKIHSSKRFSLWAVTLAEMNHNEKGTSIRKNERRSALRIDWEVRCASILKVRNPILVVVRKMIDKCRYQSTESKGSKTIIVIV